MQQYGHSRWTPFISWSLLSAASSSARLVTDFEPGAETVPRTGPSAVGAGQAVLAAPALLAAVVSAGGPAGTGTRP